MIDATAVWPQSGVGARRGRQWAAVTVACAILPALLGACTAGLPRQITEPAVGDPGIALVHTAPEQFIGRTVRWGGIVVGVENRAEGDTWIFVLGRELDAIGRPEPSDRSPGRFLARYDGFIDPDAYAKGRLLTVYGALAETVTRKIGEYDYRYPVVRVQTSELWPEPAPRPAPGCVCPPFYGPWADPWCAPYWGGPCMRPWGWPGCW